MFWGRFRLKVPASGCPHRGVGQQPSGFLCLPLACFQKGKRPRLGLFREGDFTRRSPVPASALWPPVTFRCAHSFQGRALGASCGASWGASWGRELRSGLAPCPALAVASWGLTGRGEGMQKKVTPEGATRLTVWDWLGFRSSSQPAWPPVPRQHSRTVAGGAGWAGRAAPVHGCLEGCSWPHCARHRFAACRW